MMKDELYTLLCREAERQILGRVISWVEADALTEEQTLHLLLLKAKITITLGEGKSTILSEYFRDYVIKYRLLFEEGDYRE